METQPKPYPDDETTVGDWENEPSKFKRLGGFLLDRVRGGGWADLPKPGEWHLADPVEDGWIKGVGIPDRTDGTRPRAV
jgi:hypothetical protein